MSLTHTMSDHKTERHGLVGPAALWQMKRDFQIKFLLKAGLKPEHYLCDLGCGTLRGGLPLIEYLAPGRYFGCDVRPEAMREACAELVEHNLEHKQPVLLLCPELSGYRMPRNFDFMWAFSVLFHLDDEKLDRMLDFVALNLDPGGIFFANVICGSGSHGAWREFPVVPRELAHYTALCRSKRLQVVDMGPLSQLGHVTGVAQQDEQRMLQITSGADRQGALSRVNETQG